MSTSPARDPSPLTQSPPQVEEHAGADAGTDTGISPNPAPVQVPVPEAASESQESIIEPEVSNCYYG